MALPVWRSAEPVRGAELIGSSEEPCTVLLWGHTRQDACVDAKPASQQPLHRSQEKQQELREGSGGQGELWTGLFLFFGFFFS